MHGVLERASSVMRPLRSGPITLTGMLSCEGFFWVVDDFFDHGFRSLLAFW
jgi:hypothetical protein